MEFIPIDMPLDPVFTPEDQGLVRTVHPQQIFGIVQPCLGEPARPGKSQTRDQKFSMSATDHSHSAS